jgi:hypothetical protein
MYEVTDEFAALRQAEQAFDADQSIPALETLQAAERVYFAALGAARAAFNALPDGDTKYRAEENAADTEGTDIDQLKFFRAVLSTHQYLLDTAA